LKNSVLFGDKGGFVAIVEREFDLERTVFGKFGRPGPTDLIPLVGTLEREEHDRAGVFEIKAGIHNAKGQFPIPIPIEADEGRLDQIEIFPIPLVGLQDPPAPDDLALGRVARGWLASSRGRRTRL